MAVNKIACLLSLLFLAGCRADLSRCEHKGKPAQIITNYSGKYTRVHWNNYCGFDHWNVNGERTWEEIYSISNGCFTRIKTSDPTYLQISKELDEIVKSN